jgi:hypothetical protein
MTIYTWKFNTVLDAKEVERFIDAQMRLFAENRDYLYGGDVKPIVDIMKVEHNCGAVNLEFQPNGIPGQRVSLTVCIRTALSRVFFPRGRPVAYYKGVMGFDMAMPVNHQAG